MEEHGVMRFMLKDKLYIDDIMFVHAFSSSWYNKPEKFDWVRSDVSDYIVLTDNTIHKVGNYPNKRVYGWLLESPHITPNAYQFIRDNYNKFEKVFTFKKEFIELSDKFVSTPIGGCWLEEGDRVIRPKSKLVSIIASSKKHTEGHRLRHDVITKYPIDTYGGGYKKVDNKITALKDYYFSVTIENCREDYYFSEKLIDCFMSGTVPIYWGCPSIGNFFDMNGIIVFQNIEELDTILESLTKGLYHTKKESIESNFELAKKYLVSDDEIYKKIKENEK